MAVMLPLYWCASSRVTNGYWPQVVLLARPSLGPFPLRHRDARFALVSPELMRFAPL